MWQVLQTYNIREIFRDAISNCPDVTPEAYPRLSENKVGGKMSGNVSKITRQAYRRLMIFIARIYHAHHIATQIKKTHPNLIPLESEFRIQSYPALVRAFESMEAHLGDLQKTRSHPKTIPSARSRPKTIQSMVHFLRQEIAACRHSSTILEGRLKIMEEMSVDLAKKAEEYEKASLKRASKKFRAQVDIQDAIEKGMEAVLERMQK